jgi:hypothetical protein
VAGGSACRAIVAGSLSARPSIIDESSPEKHAYHSPCEWSIIRIMRGILRLRLGATRFLACSACFSEDRGRISKGGEREGVVGVSNMERGARTRGRGRWACMGSRSDLKQEQDFDIISEILEQVVFQM